MFDGSPNVDAIEQYSSDNRCHPYVSAARLKSPLVTNISLWPDPKEMESSFDINIDIAVSERGDIATELSRMIASYMQFPANTVFMHCLGCISAAMKNFKLSYGYINDLYANLYIVTAQPPSTGKSAVNDILFNPVQKAYSEYNAANASLRNQLVKQITMLEKDIDKESDSRMLDEYFDELEKKKRQLRDVALIKPSITNTTIEALEAEAGRQAGFFNLVSDEAETINVVLGAVYSEGKAKSNSEIILKAWDNGYVSSSRIGRDGIDSHVRGTICVEYYC